MQRSLRSSVLLFTSAALLLAFAPGAAFGQLAKPAVKPLMLESGSGVELADGVVVDGARRVAYVMAPRGGIDAVELESGAALWTSATAARPLLLAGDLLLAQAEESEPGRLDLISFDVRDGRRGGLEAGVDLPEGVRARLHDGARSSFRVRAGLDGGDVVLSWQATEVGGGELQGYLPGPEEGSAPAAKAFRRLEGAVALDLDSGAVRPFAKAVLAPPSLDALPQGQAKGLAGRLFTSADRRHLLASDRVPGGGWSSYRWTLYDRATGAKLGEIDHYTSSAPFVVAGGRLFFVAQPYFQRRGEDVVEVPRQLQAVDLASGAELWAKEVTYPNFAGPFPP